MKVEQMAKKKINGDYGAQNRGKKIRWKARSRTNNTEWVNNSIQGVPEIREVVCDS